MKKINWILISNMAVCIAMIAVLIGFIVFANKLSEYKERIKRLELQYRVIEQDLEEKYEIDSEIKIIK